MKCRQALIFILLLTSVWATPSCKWLADLDKRITNDPPGPVSIEQARALYLATGNPSNAGTAPDNLLLVNSAYAASYNRDKGIANWVSWRLTGSDIGDVARQNDFRPDSGLPQNWPDINPSVYSSSGYERGHLCPSADRSSDPTQNSQTFLMTNITPQTHGLNSGPWQKLERYARSIARRKANLFIIAGQYGSKGRLKNKVEIPSNFWKVIVVVENGGGVEDITSNTRVIAVDMPNDNGIDEANWREYVTTVRAIEQKNGYDLLSNLPKNVQDAVETRIDPRSEK